MADLKLSGEPTAAALGYFDGVHIGHAKVIRMAKEQELKTAVVTFSSNPGKMENGQPVPEITSKALKEKILDEMAVDLIIYLDFEKVRDMGPQEFVDFLTEKLNVKYISCGFNYHFGKDAASGVSDLEKICIEKGIEVCSVAPVSVRSGIPLSSTRIRAYVESGDVKGASKLLGRPFSFLGEVVHGRQLGRTLGMPTLNQLLPPPQLLPRFGVYASITHIDGKRYASVTNVGVKPTVSKSEAAGAETYIIGFDGDLYGQMILVDLIDFIRPEMKFDSVDLLTEQMKSDTSKAKEIANSYLQLG